MRRSFIAPVLVVGFALACTISTSATAALTPSELAQIRDAVASAKAGNTSARVRALVARPDLNDDESASSLAQAVVAVPFTPARGTLLKDVVFGGASVASRPVLASAVVKALVARVDAILTRYAGSLDAEPEAMSELRRIYAWLDKEIADAPGRRGLGREPQNGISLAAYDDCARALAAHIERHPKWLRPEAKLTAAPLRVRAQLTLTLLDMTNESPTMRVEAADRLALSGARRSFFTELGILVLDTGVADDARIDRVRALVSRMPGAREGTSAIFFGEPKPDLVARGVVLGIGSSLESGAGKGQVPSGARANIFPDEVEPSAADPVAVELARELASVVVTRALAKRGELKLRAERDVRAVAGDVSKLLGNSEAKPEAALASAVTLLLLDGPRTVDLAVVRYLAGQPESAAIVSDALGVLAAHAGAGDASSGLQIALGRPRDDGSTETVWASQTQVGPDGSVRAFSLLGAKWELVRGESGTVTDVRKAGGPVNLGSLQHARIPVRDGSEWKGAGFSFTKLGGNPKVGLAPGGRVRLVGTHERNFDVIGTPAPGNDVQVEAELRVSGAPGGLLVRAASADSGYRGVGVFVEPNPRAGTMKIALRSIVDSSTQADVTPPIETRFSPSIRVRIAVRGNKIEAFAGGLALRGTLPPGLAKGDVALQADRGANVDVSGLTIKK